MSMYGGHNELNVRRVISYSKYILKINEISRFLLWFCFAQIDLVISSWASYQMRKIAG